MKLTPSRWLVVIGLALLPVTACAQTRGPDRFNFSDRPGYDGRAPTTDYTQRYGPISPNTSYTIGRYTGPSGPYSHRYYSPYRTPYYQRHYYPRPYYRGYYDYDGLYGGYYDRYPYSRRSGNRFDVGLGYRYYYPQTGRYSRWYGSPLVHPHWYRHRLDHRDRDFRRHRDHRDHNRNHDRERRDRD